MRLQGKLAAITAGASGMRSAASLKFAKEGAKVAIIDINEAAALDVKGQIEAGGGTAYAIRADLTNAQECRGSVADAAEKLGGLDIFWAHAGIPGTDGVADIALAESHRGVTLQAAS